MELTHFFKIVPQLFNVVLSCLLLTAFNTHIRVMRNTRIRVLPVILIWVLGHIFIWVSSNILYVVYHRLVVLILYILFSITIVDCVFVLRFYSFVYDVIFTKMRRHILECMTSYFRVYDIIF